MAVVQSDNRTHAATCVASEATRQNDVAQAIAAEAAAPLSPRLSKLREVAHYNRLAASAQAKRAAVRGVPRGGSQCGRTCVTGNIFTSIDAGKSTPTFDLKAGLYLVLAAAIPDGTWRARRVGPAANESRRRGFCRHRTFHRFPNPQFDDGEPACGHLSLHRNQERGGLRLGHPQPKLRSQPSPADDLAVTGSATAVAIATCGAGRK